MILGRDSELGLLDQVLDAGRPALVLVTSKPQMGRTSLLEALRERAVERGYRVFPAHPAALVIDQETTEWGFAEAMGLPPAVQPDPDAPPPSTPALFIIDGYHPGRAFGRWFCAQFLPSARTARPAQVIAIGAYTRDAALLEAEADQVIHLGPLGREAVDEHLRRLSAGLEEPLTPGELAAYGAACVSQPNLIGALGRLLQLELAGAAQPDQMEVSA